MISLMDRYLIINESYSVVNCDMYAGYVLLAGIGFWFPCVCFILLDDDYISILYGLE